MENSQFEIYEGCLPSPEDIRDFPLSAVSPDKINIPPEMPRTFELDILDQGRTPECVAYTGATIEQYLKLKQKLVRWFDPHWLYAQCKAQDGIPEVQGTYLRTALKIMQKQGVRTITGVNDESAYKIGSYARVDDLSFEGLKKAIFLYGTVMAGFTGSNGGWTDPSGVIRAPIAGEKTWGHCVTLVGYKADCLIGQNSWGANKQDRGFFYVPKEYLPFEAWTILTDLPVPEIGLSGWVIQKNTLANRVIKEVNLRTAPNLSGKVLTVLRPGTLFLIAEKTVKANGYDWLPITVMEE